VRRDPHGSLRVRANDPLRGSSLPPFGGVGSLAESELGRTRPPASPAPGGTGWRTPITTPRPARGGGRHPHGSDSPSEPSLANSGAIRSDGRKNPTEDASLTGLPREGRKPVPPGAGDALVIGVPRPWRDGASPPPLAGRVRPNSDSTSEPTPLYI